MGKDEIGNEPAQDNGLLNVLLAKVSAIGLDDVEKLGDDGCDAAKESGSTTSFHLMTESFDLDKCADLI